MSNPQQTQPIRGKEFKPPGFENRLDALWTVISFGPEFLPDCAFKALLFHAERTLRYNKPSDAVSLTAMTDGIRQRGGGLLRGNSGLSRSGSRKGNAWLEENKFLVRDHRLKDHGGTDSIIYTIQWEALRRFFDAKSGAVGVSPGNTPPCHQETPPRYHRVAPFSVNSSQCEIEQRTNGRSSPGAFPVAEETDARSPLQSNPETEQTLNSTKRALTPKPDTAQLVPWRELLEQYPRKPARVDAQLPELMYLAFDGSFKAFKEWLPSFKGDNAETWGLHVKAARLEGATLRAAADEHNRDGCSGYVLKIQAYVDDRQLWHALRCSHHGCIAAKSLRDGEMEAALLAHCAIDPKRMITPQQYAAEGHCAECRDAGIVHKRVHGNMYPTQEFCECERGQWKKRRSDEREAEKDRHAEEVRQQREESQRQTARMCSDCWRAWDRVGDPKPCGHETSKDEQPERKPAASAPPFIDQWKYSRAGD